MGMPPTMAQQTVSKVSVLQDFYITYLTKYADVSIGQMKIPVSWEGYNSSAKLLFPERALSSKTYGDIRDMGLRITKTFKKFGYSAGIWNGTIANNLDNNTGKDVGLRAELYPVPGVTVAGVAYATIGQRDQAGSKDRFEGDVRYEHGAVLFQAEYIHARDRGAAGNTYSQGFYVEGAWQTKLGRGMLQPAVRVGVLDPNTSASNDQTTQIDAGLNYYLQGHEAKLQAVFTRFQRDSSNPVKSDNEVIVAAQVWF
jgi:hypothetical protein